MQKLLPTEAILIGQWVKADDQVVADETCKRIEALLQSLHEVAVTDGGWTKLLLDKNYGRYWELTYPNSDWHGGGPPTLTNISKDDAQSKYKF